MIEVGAAKLIAVLAALGAVLTYTAVLIAAGVFAPPWRDRRSQRARRRRRVYRFESSGTQASRSAGLPSVRVRGRTPTRSTAAPPATDQRAGGDGQLDSTEGTGAAASAAALRPVIIAQSSAPATGTTERIEIHPEAGPEVQRIIIRRPRKRKSIAIRPRTAPYWEERGWRLVGTDLVGEYWTPRGSCAGTIRKPRSARPEFFIHNPPTALQNHNHWACFSNVGGGRYSIHFNPHPPFPDAGILAVEQVLAEAMASGRR